MLKLWFKHLKLSEERIFCSLGTVRDKWKISLLKLCCVTSLAPDLITSNLWNTFRVWSVFHTSAKKKKKIVQTAVWLRQRQTSCLLPHSGFLSFLLRILKKRDHVEVAFISCLTDADTWAAALQSFLALVWSALVKLLDPLACETWSLAEIYFEMKANTGRAALSPDKVWGLSLFVCTLFSM